MSPAKDEGARAGHGWSRWVWLACGTAAAAVMAFYLWTGQSPMNPYARESGREQGYYNLLADGFISGHLAMNAEPSPELLKLKDPYDPANTAPRMHDASFYRGKYYLYFGAAPALVWFVPWKLFLGRPISENFAVAIFCCAGFAVWSLLLLRVMRRHFPAADGVMAVSAVLLLGLGNMGLVLLRRAAFWEVPIAGAYFFNALAISFAYLALVSPRRVAFFLAAASLSVGLAIGSRPGWIFLGPGPALLALWLARPEAAGERWWSARTGRWLLAAVIPVTAVVLGILLYNFERFGDPLEFGTSYQLAGHNMHTWKMLDWGNVPTNLYYYFLSPAGFSVYFPFFEVIGAGPLKTPAGYYGVENVYGVLPNLPVVIFALAAIGVMSSRVAREQAGLRALVVAVAFAFGASLIVLLRYAASASRYMLEFVPWLLALALVGILVGETFLAGRPRRWRWLFRAGWGALAAYTVTFNVFVSFQHNNLLLDSNPVVFERLARVFNRASPLLEKFTGEAHGPLELKLRLPKNRMGQLEPLIVTGQSFRADFIYLYYTDASHLQVGFEHTGYGGHVSQFIPVDYDEIQTIRVEMGSLYPPETHPYFAGKPVTQVAELKHRLKISVNDVPYLDSNATFNESSPKDVRIGRDPINGVFGRKFTGTIVAQQRSLAPAGPAAASDYGAARLAVRFPAQATGGNEPLVVTGHTGRGDILYVSYLTPQTVQFTLDHWGVSETKSAPIDVSYEQIHVFEIDLGSMHPPPAATIPKAGFSAKYEIRMDGKVVMKGENLFHPSKAEEIYLAINPIGGSTAAANFTGQVLVKGPLARREN